MEKPQPILDLAKGVKLPSAKDARDFAEKNKDYYIAEELYTVIQTINSACEKGLMYCHVISITDRVKEILESKEYKIDFDMSRNQPSYKISW
jgi:hypothetical protein